jgi:putative ABC transport system permease protein
MAIGIGSSAAVCAFVWVLVTASLPLPQAERLFRLVSVGEGAASPYVSATEFHTWRDSLQTMDVAVIRPLATVVATEVGREPLTAVALSDGGFPVLGLTATRGRLFVPEEFAEREATSVVISQRLWQRLGASDILIGRSLRLDGRPVVVAGVVDTPPIAPIDADVWIPHIIPRESASSAPRRAQWQVYARLRPGRTTLEATAELALIGRRLAQDLPVSQAGWSARAVPLSDWETRELRRPAALLMGVALLFCLAALANAFTLLMTEVLRQRRDTAVRVALGAQGAEAIRPIHVRSVLTALCAVALMVPVYLATRQGLDSLLTQPAWMRAHHSHRAALVYAITITGALVWMLARLATAADRRSVQSRTWEHLAGSRGISVSSAGMRALLASQTVFAVLLLSLAGAFAASVSRNARTPLGYDVRQTLTAVLSPHGLADDQLPSLYETVITRLSALPGVIKVAGTNALYVQWGRALTDEVSDLPAESRGNMQVHQAHVRVVTPAFHEVLGIPKLAGRWLSDTDTVDSVRVALVTRSLATRLYGQSSAIGRPLYFTGLQFDSGPPIIVGVVGDVRQSGPSMPPEAEIFLPQAQMPTPQLSLVLRTQNDPMPLMNDVRRTINTLPGDIILTHVQTLENWVESSWQEVRTLRNFASLFALLALMSSVGGAFGACGLLLASRRQEIAIRIALGATPLRAAADILRGLLFSLLLALGAGLILAITALLVVDATVADVPFTLTPPLMAVTISGLASILACTVSALLAVYRDPPSVVR